MANCLVTQLSEAVNDSRLRKLDELQVSVHQVDAPDYTTTQRITITTSVAQTIECLPPGTFCDSSGTPTSADFNVTTTPGRVAICGNGDYNVSFPNKSAITSLRLQSSLSIDLAELRGVSGLTYIETHSEFSAGNLVSIKDMPLQTIDFTGSPITGDVSLLPSTLLSAYISRTEVSGDIKDAGHLILAAIFNASNSKLFGNLEEFAQAMVDAGRTSGTLSVNLIGSQVKYLDQAITAVKTIVFSGGTYTIS